jgi:deazaflavin-dependent oxidoreductase (nitroreductase family)
MHKTFTHANILLYRLSHGHLGNRMGGQSVLMLHTTGRRTGKHRMTTLSYYRDGQDYLLVASNWGEETNPDWYLNLLHEPHASIQVGPRTIPIVARTARSDEYDRLWQLVTLKNSQYLHYQAKIQRRIPIMVLSYL